MNSEICFGNVSNRPTTLILQNMVVMMLIMYSLHAAFTQTRGFVFILNTTFHLAKLLYLYVV
jgi:low temperature requirement protein LtrA